MWNVPITGADRMISAVTDGPGAIGSWMCNTSNSSSRSTRIVRSAAEASGVSGAIEPLATVGRLLPSGVTNVAGGAPSHGPSTRSSWPRARTPGPGPSPGLVRRRGS